MVNQKLYCGSTAMAYNMDMFKKSIIGRILSFISYLILIILSWLLFTKVFFVSDMKLSYYKAYTDLSVDNNKVKLVDQDQLAFKISIFADEKLYSGDDIRDVFDISFLHTTKNQENGFPVYSSKQLNFDKWSKNDFKDHHVEYTRIQKNHFEYWFNLTNTTMVGEF